MATADLVHLTYLRVGAIARHNAYHGRGTGPVLLSGLACSGSESSLLSCTHSLHSASCGHQNDAGVTCGSKDPYQLGLWQENLNFGYTL